MQQRCSGLMGRRREKSGFGSSGGGVGASGSGSGIEGAVQDGWGTRPAKGRLLRLRERCQGDRGGAERWTFQGVLLAPPPATPLRGSLSAELNDGDDALQRRTSLRRFAVAARTSHAFRWALS